VLRHFWLQNGINIVTFTGFPLWINPKHMHIAFFDSGLGGLSIVRELFEHPQAHGLAVTQCSYIADTAQFPYGDKDNAFLSDRIVQVVAASIDTLKPDLVVIACNTASTLALDQLRTHFSIPFVGVVPAIKPAAQCSRSQVIGILATPATVARDYTAQLIADYAQHKTVHLYGAATLVAQAENKLLGNPVDAQAIQCALLALLARDSTQTLDTIVLACTHFPLLREELTAAAPYTIQWVDSGEAIARRVIQLCERHCGAAGASAKIPLHLVTTGGNLAERYQQLQFKITPHQGAFTFAGHTALRV
jgi:glutamate racemase